jgi:hypothetical protein
MRNQLIALFCLSLSAAACGNAGIPNPTMADDAPLPSASPKTAHVAKSDAKPSEDLSFLDEEPAQEVAEAPAKPAVAPRVGDTTVHRFSGSFTKAPITLTEEVVAMAGSLMVVDYTFDQGKQHEKLRVTHEVGTDRVLRVRELHGKKELPSSSQAFEAMLAKTSFAPDSNDAEIGSESTTCLIGTQAVDCHKKSYRVKIGDETATLSLSQTNDGKDLGGEISGDNGKVFYRAELIETRTGAPNNVATR